MRMSLCQNILKVLHLPNVKNQNEKMARYRGGGLEGLSNPPFSEEKCVSYLEEAMNSSKMKMQLVFPMVEINSDRETCPACSHPLSDADVRFGWSTATQDYTTEVNEIHSPFPLLLFRLFFMKKLNYYVLFC